MAQLPYDRAASMGGLHSKIGQRFHCEGFDQAAGIVKVLSTVKGCVAVRACYARCLPFSKAQSILSCEGQLAWTLHLRPRGPLAFGDTDNV